MNSKTNEVLSVRLSDEISSTVLVLTEQKTAIIDVDYVANVVQSRIDEQHVSPHLVEHSSLLNLKQMIRGYLRNNLDPFVVAEREAAENQETLFDDILQDYYPAKRELLGTLKRVYVLRDTLSHDEVITIADRMQRVSDKLAKHSDALIAWDSAR